MADTRTVSVSSLPLPGGMALLGSLAAWFHFGWGFWAGFFWEYWAMVKIIGLLN